MNASILLEISCVKHGPGWSHFEALAYALESARRETLETYTQYVYEGEHESAAITLSDLDKFFEINMELFRALGQKVHEGSLEEMRITSPRQYAAHIDDGMKSKDKLVKHFREKVLGEPPVVEKQPEDSMPAGEFLRDALSQSAARLSEVEAKAAAALATIQAYEAKYGPLAAENDQQTVISPKPQTPSSEQ